MDRRLTLRFHGAGKTVTGSCYELALGDDRILIDCGMFQGSRTLEALNREPFEFLPRTIAAVLLTHAHIDHSGLLPRLVAEGFRGDVWCTRATRDLLAVMLPDAARIHQQDVERRNRRADRADDPRIQPLYTLEDAEIAVQLCRAAELGEEFAVTSDIRARLWNAGHILGAASVELSAGGVRMLFSGDLGPRNKSLQADPIAPSGIDHLICESTYGDRARAEVTIIERRAVLEREVREALSRGGNLVVPVFALERTQELLLDLAHLIAEGRIRRPQVFIDSPLASRATEVFKRHQNDLEDIGAADAFEHAAFHFTESVAESIRLNDVSGAIILSASGMCEAGRVRHHLLHNLPRRDSTVLFVGFQAKGTLGDAISSGAKRVRISGRDVAVRARIRKIDSYSAHADRSELIGWIEARAPIAGTLFLTHGEARAIASLKEEFAAKLPSVIAPEIGESFELRAGSPARQIGARREGVQQALGRDWQNDYASLVANLKKDLQRIESEARRTEAIRRMKAVLKEYQGHAARR